MYQIIADNIARIFLGDYTSIIIDGIAVMLVFGAILFLLDLISNKK